MVTTDPYNITREQLVSAFAGMGIDLTYATRIESEARWLRITRRRLDDHGQPTSGLVTVEVMIGAEKFGE